MPGTGPPSAGRTVVLAGATSAAGAALVRTLLEAGMRVVATGRDPHRLAGLADAVGGPAPGSTLRTVQADATSFEDMSALTERLTEVDAVIPLVGGWRGAQGIAGQGDADVAALLPAFQAVRATSRAFDAALRAAPAGRFAIVSSTAVAHPQADTATYASFKAASETWTRAVAQGYEAAALASGGPLRAAALVLRARGTLDPDSLARAVLALWDLEAATLNGSIREL
ncbi:SDR family NAD(P)-dependent oxidoreductase [Brachybacterium hainanense]|uniref:SDR family NAD(P)-dependent oxidoreductase n=1 Tax=Brachybacterium hainanense TaxID=1541174 RepID=A0ABV6R9E0_9MICO